MTFKWNQKENDLEVSRSKKKISTNILKRRRMRVRNIMEKIKAKRHETHPLNKSVDN